MKRKVIYEVFVMKSVTVEIDDDEARFELPKECYTPEGWTRDGVRVLDADNPEIELDSWD